MGKEVSLDEIDLEILSIYQQNVKISVEDLAARVGLTKTPCWRRLQRLEQTGIIKSQVAILDCELLGLGVSVFVQVKTNNHNSKWLKSFSEAVTKFPEVLAFYRMSGEYDYLLRVVVKDIASYDDFYKRFIEECSLTDVSSYFAMEEIKCTTELPLKVRDLN